MTNLEKLKKEHPDLVEEYSQMTKNNLLEQICAEVNDLLAMERRVQVFMNECTLGLSHTTYTPESIKQMVSDKKEHDIREFCADLLEDFNSEEDILNYLREKRDERD